MMARFTPAYYRVSFKYICRDTTTKHTNTQNNLDPVEKKMYRLTLVLANVYIQTHK